MVKPKTLFKETKHQLKIKTFLLQAMPLSVIPILQLQGRQKFKLAEFYFKFKDDVLSNDYPF